MKKITHFMLLTGIFLLSSFAAFSQKTIKGTITDAESKEPLPGASIIIKGTAKGTFTDDKGQYTLEVPAGATTLIYSFVGYTSKDVNIGDASTIDVLLGTGLELDNIVVIGSRNAS